MCNQLQNLLLTLINLFIRLLLCVCNRLMPRAAGKDSARAWKYPALQTKSVLLEYFREYLGGEEKKEE